jgi:hypothetical protein
VGLSGHIFVVPRFPSKSGLMHKHIVKHIGFGFIFGALVPNISCPNYRKHVVPVSVRTNTQTSRENISWRGGLNIS